MMLSEHFSLAELTSSDYAVRHSLNNMPEDAEVLENLHILAQGLERCRAILNKPMVVTSGYRSPKVNSAVGGSKTSDHMKGLAADFVVPSMSAREVCLTLAKHHAEIGFRQLIQEGNRWTHISFPDVDQPAAGQILTAIFKDGKANYVQGIA